MATRTITTSIALDGEQKFKQQMGEVNRELRNLDSEMKLVEETFKGQANTTEALTAKGELMRREVDQQEEKVRALENALKDATEAFGETDAKTDGYRQSLNRARTDLLKLNAELDDNERYLDEAKRSADGAAESIDEFGRETKNVKLKDMGLGDFVEKLGSLKGALLGGAIVGGVKEIAGAINEVVESTAEYRKIMGTLETSSAAAGYSAEETKEIYSQLYTVLGDTQAAATAAANLQALGLGQENLRKMTDLAIGAWATYGDSIPIDGLAESINETIKAAQITGNFADVLNWAGISEDEFNTKLQEAATYGDRVNLVMKTLTEEGLADTAQSWRENNQDIVAMNESTSKMDEAMAQLGERLAPIAAGLTNLGAEAISGVLIPAIDTAIEKVSELTSKFIDMERKAREAGTSLAGQGYNFGFMDMKQQVATGQASYANVVEALTPATTADLQQVAAAASGIAAASGGRIGSESVVIPITLELDGDVLARKQARYNSRQQTLAGTSMID